MQHENSRTDQKPYLRLRSAAASAWILAALTLAAPSAALASQTALAPTVPFVVTVVPASGPPVNYFSIRVNPATTKSAGKLLLTNRTSTPLRLWVDPVDGLTATKLGSAYAVRGLRSHGPTLWTRLSARSLVIAPHGSGTITVAVQVPVGTPPGDYLSGIALQTADTTKTQKIRSNLAVSSVVRYAIGLEVMLPGPRHPRLLLTGASLERRPAGLTFLLDARNSGNVILQQVTGRVLITRGSRTVADDPIAPGTFVTATSITYPVVTPREQPKAGTTYRLRAVLRYRGGSAYLDRTLVFGIKQARLQQQFGGPKVPSAGSGPSTAIFVAIAALVVLALAAAGAQRWRRRAPHAGALAMLGKALGRADTSAPVSVILIRTDADGDAPSPSSRMQQLIRRRLRPSDSLAATPGGRLVIVAPDTCAQTATGLAQDLRATLDRELGNLATGIRVGTATSEEPQPAEALLARADADSRQPGSVR